MNRKFVIGIAIITTAALLGVIITQFIWVQQAIHLRNDQFVDVARFNQMNVVHTVNDLRQDSLIALKQRDTAGVHEIPFDGGLDYFAVMDSLIGESFGCLKDAEFHWAVVDSANHKILFGRYDEKYSEALFQTPMMVSAEQIYDHKKGVYLSFFFPGQKQLVVRKMSLWILILSGFFLMVVGIGFVVFMHTILKQKKLSEMKNDFINNMTHEFKTPISTISVASEMLMKQAVQSSPERLSKYANVIFDENLRLRNQVEQVLHISMLEKEDFKVKLSVVDVHRIIENTVDIFKVILRERNGVIHTNLYALKTEIEADEVHLINVFSNLLDNAAKYANGRPEISISTRDGKDGIEIVCSDRGIGISNENLKHIFKKFYRVHTGDRHDVKGFGLGLFYVKTIIDAHKGSIKVTSDLKKGSTFELYLPYKSSLTDHDQC